MIKYVIFDKDGTLIDTEPFYYKSWYTVGERWGLGGMRENYHSNIAGKGIALSIDFLKETFGESLDAQSLMNERMAMVEEMLEGEIPIKRGCIELLDFLKKHGIKIAVATSTPEDIAVRNLKRLGLYDKTDAVVTGDMVSRGKPHPDIFIEAGRRIGAVPEETLVVGDSSFDIIGGHRAGMRAVMVVDQTSLSDEAKPLCLAVYDSLFGVIDLVSKENNIIRGE